MAVFDQRGAEGTSCHDPGSSVFGRSHSFASSAPWGLVQPTDVVTVPAQPVAAAAFRKVGFSVDLQPMDRQTLVTRRTSQNHSCQGWLEQVLYQLELAGNQHP